MLFIMSAPLSLLFLCSVLKVWYQCNYPIINHIQIHIHILGIVKTILKFFKLKQFKVPLAFQRNVKLWCFWNFELLHSFNQWHHIIQHRGRRMEINSNHKNPYSFISCPCDTGKCSLITKIVSVTGKMTNEWSKVLFC